MPKPSDQEQPPSYEQLLQFCEQLQAQVESLTQDNAALREQLETAESEAERLHAIVDAEAEAVGRAALEGGRLRDAWSIATPDRLGFTEPTGWPERADARDRHGSEQTKRREESQSAAEVDLPVQLSADRQHGNAERANQPHNPRTGRRGR